jgi:hypothetical protein
MTDPEQNEPARVATHPASLSADKLLEECEVRRLRRSGPGGQHRNKVETAVQLHHRRSGVRAEANERRSQSENQKVALGRLRVNLALEVRTVRTLDAIPSPLWQSRSAGGRLSVSATSDDFAVLLAEALDVIAACDWDVKRAAEALGSTPSQLTKLLWKEPRAAAMVNRQRKSRGLWALQERR